MYSNYLPPKTSGWLILRRFLSIDKIFHAQAGVYLGYVFFDCKLLYIHNFEFRVLAHRLMVIWLTSCLSISNLYQINKFRTFWCDFLWCTLGCQFTSYLKIENTASSKIFAQWYTNHQVFHMDLFSFYPIDNIMD